MTDKDSWWQDDATDSGVEDNSFGPISTQNDASAFEPRGVNEGFEPILELSQKKDIKSNNPWQNQRKLHLAYAFFIEIDANTT